MKFYAACMVTNIKPQPDTASEWVEITDAQHTKIMNILLQNKNLGGNVRYA